MSDAPPGGGTEPEGLHSTLQGGEKVRRRERRPPQPRPLPLNEAAEKAAERVRAKLAEMVDAAAQTEANRRRATAVDAPDYETGFDLVAGPSRRRRSVEIVADVAGAIGAMFAGYSINIYTGGSQSWLSGHIAILAGLVLTSISIVLKYAMTGK